MPDVSPPEGLVSATLACLQMPLNGEQTGRVERVFAATAALAEPLVRFELPPGILADASLDFEP